MELVTWCRIFIAYVTGFICAVKERSLFVDCPYFFWWLKYLLNSTEEFDTETIRELIRNYQEKIPDFSETETSLNEIENHLDMIEEKLSLYEEEKDETYLGEIQEITDILTHVTSRVYCNDFEFFNKFLPVTKENFVEREAIRVVEYLPLFTKLKDIINSGYNISENELWDYLDELKDIIYDIQDGDLVEMLEEELNAPAENKEKMSLLIDFFEGALDNLEEGLGIIERSFRDRNMESAKDGMKKIHGGLVDLKIVEILSVLRGAVNE